MKTTIDIAEPILRQAKELAVRRGTTLGTLIEEALLRVLDDVGKRRAGFRLETHTFGGRGLQPGLAWGDWDALRNRAYEDRGG